MSVSIEMAWIAAVLLISIRLAAVFLLTPVLALMQVPVRFRVLLVLMLAAILVSAGTVDMAHVPLTLGGVLSAAATELVIGVALAFGLFTAFGAFLLGGRVVDMQMGFGVASLIDPATREQTSLIGTLLNMLAVMVFFIIDGHHMIIRGLAFSLERLAPGGAIGDLSGAAVMAQFGAMFIFAVMIVAPALFAILLVDVGLGVMARTMPQVNIFIVSLPIKIFLGLVVTAISIPYLGPVMTKIFEHLFLYWQDVLGAA